MFEFFKRNKSEIPKHSSLTAQDFNFLKNLLSILPDDYEYLRHQVSSDFLIKKSPMLLKKKGNIGFSMDENLFNKLKRTDIAESAKLSNILIKSRKGGYTAITIHLLNGNLWGYYLDPHLSFEDLDFRFYDMSKFQLRQFNSSDKEELKNILGDVPNEILKNLDVESTFKIELREGEFYVIKEFGNGDYLAVDKFGQVYGLFHDPYLIEKIYDNKDSFYKALQKDEFDMNKYYESKFD